MSERSEYAPGTPSWVDLSSPDVDASAEFYGGLFGWEKADAPGDPETTGGYGFFTQNGKMVTGVVPAMQEGQRPAWTTYVSVADAEETAGKVRGAGGEVMFEPMDVMEAGRMAVFSDAEGAVFSVWQPGQHKGAEIVNEPVSMGWNELLTRDPAGAKEFYGSVFGWKTKEMEVGDTSYTTWQLANGSEDSPIGGMLEISDQMPAEMPPNWMTYFVVEDADDTAARAKELGANVMAEPFDIGDMGRIAILLDPQGAAFAIFQGLEEPAG